MICCPKRMLLALLLPIGLIVTFGASLPAQNQDKKDKKPPAKKEEKQPEEPKKEVVKPKLDVPLMTLKGHTYWVNQVGFSVDGKKLASAGRDRTVRVWDAANGKEIKVIKGLPQSVKSVVFLPDGRLAGTSGKWDKTKKAWQGEVVIWDLGSGKTVSLKGHSETIESLAVTSDGKKLASASDDQTALIWDVSSGKILYTLKGHTDGIWSVAFSRDGSKLASAGKDKTVKIWDVASGKDLLTLKNPLPVQPKKAPAKAEQPKDKKAKDEKAKDEKTKDGKGKDKAAKDKEKKAKEQPPEDPTRDMTSVSFNPAGDRVAAGNLDGTVKIWEVATGKKVLDIKAGDGIWAVAFSPDGKRLAAAGWDRLIHVFDAGNGKTLFTIVAHDEPISSLAFSPDGSRLASGSLDQTIRIWGVKK